jgi:hypothetical protein
MTAPGNDILLTLLLIAFIGSSGYAGGRIHQWYRTSLDRDQAYRDGYDTATRSLFSLASRIIRPRRSEKAAVRGTATVTSILAAPGAAGHGATPDPAGHGATHGAAGHGATHGAAGHGATHGAVADRANHGHVAHGAAAHGMPPAAAAHGMPPGAAHTGAPGAAHATGVAGTAGRRPAPAPAAATAAPALRSVPRRAAAEAASDDTRPASVSQGRHTVPDELVRAATYRLSADRVARAKVPPKDVTREPTPRPRAS